MTGVTLYPLPGDFGVLTTRQKHTSLLDRFAEWAICFGTKSSAFHAFIYAGNGQIIEAVRRVKASPASTYDNITWSTGRLPAHLVPTDAQRDAIVAAARSYVGEGYNILDILAIALAQKRLGGEVDSDDWIARRLNDDGRLICSQLVALSWLKAGINLCPGKLAGLISPGDLYGLLGPRPNFVPDRPEGTTPP